MPGYTDLGRSRDCSRRKLCQRKWELVSYELMECTAEAGATLTWKRITATLYGDMS